MTLLITFIIFDSNSYLTDKELIDIYVYTRHPHHYLPSSFINLSTILWFSFPLILFLFSYIMKNKIVRIYSLFASLLTIGPIILQYIFTELVPISFLSIKISPIRVLSYSLFIYIILTNIIIGELVINKKYLFLNKSKNFIMSKVILIGIIFTFLISFSTTLIQKKDILYWNKDAAELVNYAKYNIAKKDLVFAEKDLLWLLAYLRSFSEKNIYHDNIFLFNENLMLEWANKNNMSNIFYEAINSNFNYGICMMSDTGIKYFVIYTKQIEGHDMYKHNIFSNKSYTIIQLPKFEECRS